jgi:HPt (histidine-containing phosphotransfer) domain-containing protein
MRRKSGLPMLDTLRHKSDEIAAEWPGRDERRRRSRPDDGVKPVDLAYLRRFTHGDFALEEEVLRLFIRHAPEYLAAMRSAGSAKAWHDAAHTLKGASRGIGAWRVARCAEGAERLRFDTDLDRRAFTLDGAAEALEEAIGYIEVVLRSR